MQNIGTDILIAGGGIAGVAAALAAARNGARVVICQDRPMLGGNASSEIRMHVSGADGSGARGKALQTEAREGGIVEEIRLRSAVENPQCSPTQFDLLLYDLCRNEPGISLMLNTLIEEAETDGVRITAVHANQISTDRRFRIEAQIMIDATGDADLAYAAGAAFWVGDDPAERHRAGGPYPSTRKQGSSLLFMARRHDRPMPFRPPTWARKVSETDLRRRPHAVQAVDYGLEYGFWWIEWGGLHDTIGDNELIRDELLAILMGVWDHIKNGGNHNAENWALEWTGWVPGKRESRRIIGRIVLSEKDLYDACAFEDGITYGGWPIDIHPPEGIDGLELEPCEKQTLPYLYEIPLRACIARDCENLMMAGRNISTTPTAFASTRVMATCGAVGEGVGTAAAMGLQTGLTPAQMAGNPDFLASLRQQLMRQDAVVLGEYNGDSNDLARSAQISASSAQLDGPAVNVISGQSRSLHGAGGARADRTRPGTHRWMSEPAAGLPAYLLFDWTEPRTVGTVMLIFDTGLHRPLTLTHSTAFRNTMQWGPQPETVRDYLIEVKIADSWRTLLKISDNILRRRVHVLDADRVSSLRIWIESTHGLNHARVCEVRIYPT